MKRVLTIVSGQSVLHEIFAERCFHLSILGTIEVLCRDVSDRVVLIIYEMVFPQLLAICYQNMEHAFRRPEYQSSHVAGCRPETHVILTASQLHAWETCKIMLTSFRYSNLFLCLPACCREAFIPDLVSSFLEGF